MADWLAQLTIIGEVALGILLGGIIGIEREVANKPAGFRTHMLVAGAAALLVGLGDALIRRFGASVDSELISSDPIRIVGAVITGISFLGAGTIFRHARTQQVEGLTTAASLLFSGAIGISVALQQFVLAFGATVLAVTVLRGLKLIEARIKRRLPQSSAP
jgi:putative Mg2+ transporter-C (MgtC) family protein